MRAQGLRLIFIVLAATASCGGRYNVGNEPGAGGAGGASAGGDPGIIPSAGGASNAGGAPTTIASSEAGVGQAGTPTIGTTPPSRCDFSPDLGNFVLGTTARGELVASRIAYFLNDNAFGFGPDGLPDQATAAWATAFATSMLDVHSGSGTAPAGFVRFLSAWLKVAPADAGFFAAQTWSAKLADPNATLTTLLAGPSADPLRNGILTDKQVLATRPGISARGAWMDKNLLCSEIPPPPANIPPPPAQMPNESRRQWLQRDLMASAVCFACHTVMDTPGFSLEHFDALGDYRDVDNGVAVDSSGTLASSMLTFKSIDDLAPQLAMSCEVAQCFTRALMTDAFGVRDPSAALPFSDAEVNRAASMFVNSSFSIRELVKAIVSTPSFLR